MVNENEAKTAESKRPHRGDKIRSRFVPSRFLLPSLVTMVGIFCGFLAIVSASQGKFLYAVQCILFAIILDGLDGRIARRLNATSAFGREFDSLSDVIAFGVAPALLMYYWGFDRLADEFGILISFVFVVCSATRLARFNIIVDEEPKGWFTGLPTPAAAAALAALVYYHPEQISSMLSTGLLTAYTIFLALMMVSTFHFLSVKNFKLTQTNLRQTILLLAVTVGLLWYHSKLLIPILLGAYACSGPLLWMKNKNKKV